MSCYRHVTSSHMIRGKYPPRCPPQHFSFLGALQDFTLKNIGFILKSSGCVLKKFRYHSEEFRFYSDKVSVSHRRYAQGNTSRENSQIRGRRSGLIALVYRHGMLSGPERSEYAGFRARRTDFLSRLWEHRGQEFRITAFSQIADC